MPSTAGSNEGEALRRRGGHKAEEIATDGSEDRKAVGRS